MAFTNDTTGQTTEGIRSILSSAWAYETLQRIVGKAKLRRIFSDRYIVPQPGMRVLDVGCGPGDMAPFVRPADYVGVDVSDAYIAAAQRRFGSEGTFICAGVEDLPPEEKNFDVAIAIGVFHHLTDEVARAIIDATAQRLTPDGRFVAIEPHFHEGQHLVSRALISLDRGRNVRSVEGYRRLFPSKFTIATHEENDMFYLPYSLVVLDGTLSPETGGGE